MFILAFIAVLGSGCANSYVSDELSAVSPEEIPTIANPQPVQLIFEFRSKGAANPKVTELLEEQVSELVASSNVFSAVGDQPTENKNLLTIVIDNVPITDQSAAAAKGFGTGLTFGLVGSTVIDGYICTIEHVGGPGGSPINAELRHALYTTVGAKGAPENTTKAKNIEEGIRTILDHLVMNGLKSIASDASFAGEGA